jgi:hypothetical protein
MSGPRFALISVILMSELRGLRLDRGLDRIVVVGYIVGHSCLTFIFKCYIMHYVYYNT